MHLEASSNTRRGRCIQVIGARVRADAGSAPYPQAPAENVMLFTACQSGADPASDTSPLKVPRSWSRRAFRRSSSVSILAMYSRQRPGLSRGAGVGAVHDADDGGEGRVQAHAMVQAEGVGVLAGEDQDGLNRRERLDQCLAGFDRCPVSTMPGEARAPPFDLVTCIPDALHPFVDSRDLVADIKQQTELVAQLIECRW